MTRKPLLTLRQALWGVLILWMVFTAVYAWHPGDLAAAWLEFIPGVLGVGLLLSAGFTRQDCFLQARPLSRRGLVLLAISALFMPVILASGRFTGWKAGDWTAAWTPGPRGFWISLTSRKPACSWFRARLRMRCRMP